MKTNHEKREAPGSETPIETVHREPNHTKSTNQWLCYLTSISPAIATMALTWSPGQWGSLSFLFCANGVASGVERRGRFEPAFGEKPCLWWHLMASFPRNITGLVVLQKSGELTMFADDVGLPDPVPNVQRSQQSRPQALYDATWLGLMYFYAFVFGVHLCSWFLDVSPQARCQNPKNAGRFLPPIQSSIAPRPAWDGTQNEIVLWL